jgi:DNA-binding transcriptional ArsR family regulator
VFEIFAEPNRRAILSLLVSSQQPVGEIERQLGMPQPTCQGTCECCARPVS